MLKDLIKNIDKRLLVIFILALFIRVLGSTHGFPFITHPDEPAVVRSTTGMRFDHNPGHFDWPHMHYYINFAAYAVFIYGRGFLQILGLRPVLESIFPLIWRDPLVFYFISRLISSSMAALTVFPIYYAAKELFNNRAALFAATAFAIIPFHVWHSHYTLIDAPMVFWLSLSLYFSVRILKVPDMRNYILAGLFVGFSASTKYNGGLASIMIFVAHILRVYSTKGEKIFDIGGLKKLLLSGAFAVFGFILGTPHAVLDYETFLTTDSPRGALWQFTNVGKVSFIKQFEQLFRNFYGKLAEDTGYTFIISYVLVVFYTIVLFIKNGIRSFKTDKNLWFLLVPSLFLFWYVSGFSRTRSHYYMVGYPFVAIAVGYFCDMCFNKLRDNKYKYLAKVAIYVVPAYLTLLIVVTFLQTDTRNKLYDWMLSNVREGDSIVYHDNDLKPVVEKFDSNEIKKGIDRKYLRDNHGYILVSDRGSIQLDREGEYIKLGNLYEKPVFEAVPGITQSGPHIVVIPF
jgi:hypothetical protein